jgi:hypothetical protein
MSRLKYFWLCVVSLSFSSISTAAPLDSADIIYLDGLPCNRACQTYMAWSQRVLGQPSPPVKVSSVDIAKVPEQPTKAVSASVTPKRNDIPVVQANNLKAAVAAKITVKVAKVPTPKPKPIFDAAPPESQATMIPPVQDLQTIAPSAEKNGENEADAVDLKTAALIPPPEGQMIAVFMVRQDINSIADLTKKTIAIDASLTASLMQVQSGIVAAGAADVSLSEDNKLALIRVMDGDVPAGVVSIATPEESAVWTAIPGFNVLRMPLAPVSGHPRG